MPKYKFIYNVSEGIFQMDVFTGMYILADNQTQALKSASRLDTIISDFYNFRVSFELMPQPHISVNCNISRDRRNLNPEILKYHIQNNFDSSKRLLGLPVYTENNFKNVSAVDFLEELQNNYVKYLKCVNKTGLSFVTIAKLAGHAETR